MWLIDITLVENKLHDGVVTQRGLSTAHLDVLPSSPTHANGFNDSMTLIGFGEMRW